MPGPISKVNPTPCTVIATTTDTKLRPLQHINLPRSITTDKQPPLPAPSQAHGPEAGARAPRQVRVAEDVGRDGVGAVGRRQGLARRAVEADGRDRVARRAGAVPGAVEGHVGGVAVRVEEYV